MQSPIKTIVWSEEFEVKIFHINKIKPEFLHVYLDISAFPDGSLL